MSAMEPLTPKAQSKNEQASSQRTKQSQTLDQPKHQTYQDTRIRLGPTCGAVCSMAIRYRQLLVIGIGRPIDKGMNNWVYSENPSEWFGPPPLLDDSSMPNPPHYWHLWQSSEVR